MKIPASSGTRLFSVTFSENSTVHILDMHTVSEKKGTKLYFPCHWDGNLKHPSFLLLVMCLLTGKVYGVLTLMFYSKS